MNSQKRNTENLDLKEENSSRFYSWGLQRTVVKKVRSIAFFLAFSFCLSLSNIFFLYHPFPPRTSANIRRKGSLSSSWRWRRRCYRRPVDTYHISQLAMTGWGMTWVGASCTSVETCLETCLELPKSRYLIFLYSDLMDQFEGSQRFDDHQWNSSAARESSRVIILKSRLNSTGHYACTSEVRDIFYRQTYVPNNWWQLMCSNILQPWDRRNSMTAPVRNIT